MTDWTGDDTDSAAYTAFGERVSGTQHRYGYAGAWGYQTHDDLAFLHVGHRYYDPAAGRFLQRDPIGISGGLNVYEYVWSAPTVLVDSDGEWPLIVVGAVVGVIVGGASAWISGGGAKDIVAGAIGGAVGGALAGAGVPGSVAGAAGGAVSGAITGGAEGAVVGAATGAAAGLIGGKIGGRIGGAAGVKPGTAVGIGVASGLMTGGGEIYFYRIPAGLCAALEYIGGRRQDALDDLIY